MEATIYYFSSTGNSLYLARRLSGALGGCALKSMASPEPQGPVGGPGKAVGFVFPVYFVGPPRLVKRYIENLDILPGTYCFAIVSYGGSVMDTLGMLQDILRSKGLDLSYGAGSKMPDTWLLKYSAAEGDKAEKINSRANEIIDRAADDIAHGRKKAVGRFWRPLSKKFNNVIYTGIAAWDKSFRVGGNCTGCSQCAAVCPVDNILMEDKKPVWQHRCERCLGCAHWCPVSAIDYGNKTKGRKRYHHPGVTAGDIKAGKR